MEGYSPYNIKKPLYMFTEYDHLSCTFKLCFEHYTARIQKLHSHISPQVRNVMMSLASAEEIPDYNGTLTIICGGGKKAIGKFL